MLVWRATSMSKWLDYLDKCWDDGYRAYELEPTKDLIHVMAPTDINAREAFFGGWRRAKHEYEDTPPDKA